MVKITFETPGGEVSNSWVNGYYHGRGAKILCLPLTSDDDTEAMIRMASELSIHPNISSFYGYEDRENQRFMAFELGKLRGLEKLIILGVSQMQTVFRHIVSGLGYMHGRGYVHTCLQDPTKYVVEDRAECFRVKLSIEHCRLLIDQGACQGHTRNNNLNSLAQSLIFLLCGRHMHFNDFYNEGPRVICRIDYYKEEAFDFVSRCGTQVDCQRLLKHPFLWDSERRLNFLRDCSERFKVDQVFQGKVSLHDMDATRSWRKMLESLYDDLEDAIQPKDPQKGPIRNLQRATNYTMPEMVYGTRNHTVHVAGRTTNLPHSFPHYQAMKENDDISIGIDKFISQQLPNLLIFF